MVCNSELAPASISTRHAAETKFRHADPPKDTGLPVRVIDATLINAVLTVTTEVGTRIADYGLVTLYHERWEIESAYCELTPRILGGRVLRGRHPGAVMQEMWALLTCYQVLRTAITGTTLRHCSTPASIPTGRPSASA